MTFARQALSWELCTVFTFFLPAIPIQEKVQDTWLFCKNGGSIKIYSGYGFYSRSEYLCYKDIYPNYSFADTFSSNSFTYIHHIFVKNDSLMLLKGEKLLKCRCIFFPNKVYLSLGISITALRKNMPVFQFCTYLILGPNQVSFENSATTKMEM